MSYPLSEQCEPSVREPSESGQEWKHGYPILDSFFAGMETKPDRLFVHTEIPILAYFCARTSL